MELISLLNCFRLNYISIYFMLRLYILISFVFSILPGLYIYMNLWAAVGYGLVPWIPGTLISLISFKIFESPRLKLVPPICVFVSILFFEVLGHLLELR